jgi:integrase
MTLHIERDRHYDCQPQQCVAPPRRRPVAGQAAGKCTPRRCWWLRVRFPDGARQSQAFADEGEARLEGRRVEARLTLGQAALPRREAGRVPTFAEVARAALALAEGTSALRPGTIENRDAFLRNHLLGPFGALPVTPETFNRLVLREFIAKVRTTRGLSDSTLANNLPLLRLILDHAVERGLLPANPMRGEHPLWKRGAATAPEPPDPFTPAELARILAAARSFAALVQLAVQAGLRPGEALGLRQADVDPARGLVQVRRTFSRRQLGPPKTAKSTRAVSCLHPVVEARAVWRPADAGIETRRVLADLRALPVVSTDPEGPLVGAATDPSQPMRQSYFDRLWHRALKKAGVRYRKPHALRHTWASTLIARGAPITYVTKRGGWENPTVLLETYAHWVELAEEAGEIASSPASSGLSGGKAAEAYNSAP